MGTAVAVSSEVSRPVAVTGATGFLGINLLHRLSGLGYPVVGLASRPLPVGARDSIAAQGGPEPTVLECDVRDTGTLLEILRRQRPTVVIHTAAVTAGPDRERRDARSIVDVNVGGTQSVLDASTAAGVGRFVHASSGAVYGEPTFGSEPLHESAAVRPSRLYGITKLAAEQLVRRHGEVHDVETVVARLSAVYGPWEYATGVRDFMSPLLQLALAAERGDVSRYVPDQDRNWLVATDAARAFVEFATGPVSAFDCVNLAPAVRTNTERWIVLLRHAYPHAGFESVDDPADATITYDADPRRPRAVVDTTRVEAMLGSGWATAPDEAMAGYLDWFAGRPR